VKLFQSTPIMLIEIMWGRPPSGAIWLGMMIFQNDAEG
jgi:hypothetical protein